MRAGTREGLYVWAACAVFVVAVSTAAADMNVLAGMPEYRGEPLDPDDPRVVLTEGLDISTIDLTPAEGRAVYANNPLGDVPEYVWWYGCTPTSAGMLMAYWNDQPGRGNLYKKGDAQFWNGDGTSGTRRMVSSQGHIDQSGGHDLAGCAGTTDQSLSCFLHTDPSAGGTYWWDIAPGIEGFVEWDDTSAYDMKDAYDATAVMEDVAWWQTPGHAFNFQDLKNEIDAGRPMLLDLQTYQGDWYGHSVVAYGYQDDMFQVKVPLPGGGQTDLTVGGFAVRDTWANGTGQSDWFDWNYNVVTPIIDGDGVEWWPFVELQGSSWTARWDWMIVDGVSLDIVPEPASLALLALGGAALLRRRRG